MTSATCAKPDLTFGALLAALLLALALAGCGRVGPLDLPPGVSTDLAPNPGKRGAGANVMGTTQTPLIGAAPASTEPTAAPGQKRPLPIDWLLN